MANSPAYGLSTFALTTAGSTGNTTVFSNALTGATEFTIDGYGNVTSASNTIVGRSLVFSDGSVMSTAGGASARFAYTGDGVTTAYSTGNYSATTTLNTNVYISGVYQNKDQYSWSGTTITFTQPPPAGLAIEIMITTINYSTTIPVPGSVGPSTLTVGGPTWYPNGNVATTGNLLVGNTLVFSDGSTLTSSAVYATRFTYTGDGVTTTFSTGNYNATTVNNTNIYIGSIYQLKSQYTWTGTTITFTQAPPNGASIEIMLNVLNSTTIVPAQASVTPSALSTGGPSWDSTGNLTITGNLRSTGTSASYFAGNVGIATSATYRLDVTDQNNAMMRLTQYSDVDGAVIRGFRAKGTIAAPLAVVADNVLTGFRAFGWTSSAAFSPLSAAINLRAAEAFTSSASGTYIDFATTATGTTGGATERMRIDSSGNVSINTTTINAGNKLTVAGGALNITDATANRLYMGFGTIPGAGTGAYIYNGDNSALAFGTTNTERMRIDQYGNVSIGTTGIAYPNGGRTSLSLNGTSQAIMSLSTAGTGRAYFYNDSSNTYLYTESTGGQLSLGTIGSAALNFTVGNTTRAYFDTSGHLQPATTGTYDLGSTSLRWRNFYTSDLHLSNSIGDYTIVEGEEDLYLVNNKTKKSFKFALIPVPDDEVPPRMPTGG